jgi:hypothetical protein
MDLQQGGHSLNGRLVLADLVQEQVVARADRKESRAFRREKVNRREGGQRRAGCNFLNEGIPIAVFHMFGNILKDSAKCRNSRVVLGRFGRIGGDWMGIFCRNLVLLHITRWFFRNFFGFLWFLTFADRFFLDFFVSINTGFFLFNIGGLILSINLALFRKSGEDVL